MSLRRASSLPLALEVGFASALALLPSCMDLPRPSELAPDHLDYGAERLLFGSRLFDGATGDPIEWSDAIERLADADVVFLGETHTDRLTHDAELAFLLRLTTAREGATVLAMEMFERDVQPALDDYLAGRIAEPEFLARSRPWGNYKTDYRGLVEYSRRNGLPVIASNLPTDLRRKLARGGEEAWKALTPEERKLVPDRLIENPPEYWVRVENATRGHAALGMAAAASRLYDGQNLWDNTMADAIAQSLTRWPDSQVVHVNGGFHSLYGQGTAWQVAQRVPGVNIKTVQIVTTSDLASARVDPEKPATADVIVVVEARARSAEDGVLAVRVAREHGFRLVLPHGASVGAPLPLLVWLCDEGQSGASALELWKPAIGDRAAILVIDPSFPWLAPDGGVRGRWWFPGQFGDGGSLASQALSKVLEVVTREDVAQGMNIDPARVVVAGEGAAATMTLHAARYLDEEAFRALAFAPSAVDEFASLSLPLPLSPRRAPRTVGIEASAESLAKWQAFAAGDAELKLTTSVVERAGAAGAVAVAADRAAADYAQLAATCAALGLDAPVPCAAADALFAALPDHAAGRLLARQLARRVRAAGLAATPDLAITPAAFADGSRLPRSSGAFGGTTIVVLPATATADELAEWKALEEPDVIQQKSRFHRLRIAQGYGDSSPRAVIEKLRAENAQRRDFLLVPAILCADESELLALRAGLGDLATQVNLEFLPGLGAALPIGAR